MPKKNHFSIWFAMIAAVMTLLLIAPHPTSADCSADGALTDGDVVTCTTEQDTTPQDAGDTDILETTQVGSGQDNVQVTVDEGVTIETNQEGIVVGENSIVVNNGTVQNSPGVDGIRVGDNSEVINNGTVQGNKDDGIQAAGNSTTTNNGTITGNGYAVFANGTGGTIINNGSADANGQGLTGGHDITLTNNGTVDDNTYEGVGVGRADITN